MDKGSWGGRDKKWVVRVESRAEVGNKTYTWGSSVIQINIKHRMRSPREGVQIESKV